MWEVVEFDKYDDVYVELFVFSPHPPQVTFNSRNSWQRDNN